MKKRREREYDRNKEVQNRRRKAERKNVRK